MDSAFEPYAERLGIEDKQRPLTNYQLMGLVAFESQTDTIESHAQQQLAKLAPLSRLSQDLRHIRQGGEGKANGTRGDRKSESRSHDVTLKRI